MRGNTQAATDAHEMLVALDSITAADGSFSAALINQQGKTAYYHGWDGPAPGHSGRFVGALIKYYRVSADPLALELARKYALHCLDTAFDADGRLIGAWDQAGAGNHVHSITSSLSSILIWALELTKVNGTNDLAAIDLGGSRTLEVHRQQQVGDDVEDRHWRATHRGHLKFSYGIPRCQPFPATPLTPQVRSARWKSRYASTMVPDTAMVRLA